MRSISIQVQPDRMPELDIEKIKQFFEELKDNSLVKQSAFDEGNDKGRYLNFTYGTNDAKSLWGVIQRKIYEHNMLGKQLLKCSMAMCSSEEGWDNYLLLHHFDPSVSLESFE